MSSFERNIIHISFSGGNDMVTLQESDKILVFNQQTNTFDEVSRLQQRRRLHSVSLVSMSDYTCATTTTPTTLTPTGEISSILIIDLYIYPKLSWRFGSLCQFHELRPVIETYYHLLIIGLLIVGGETVSIVGRKVELFHLATKQSCLLPNLPEWRREHTSVNGVVCGASNPAARTNCVDISSGSWSSDKYQPIRPRRGHIAWKLPTGELILVGGMYERRTTDIVYTNGTVVPGFNLQYDVL